jgi:hypothetical protein
MVQNKVLIDLLLDAEIVCVSRDLNGADHIIDICDSPFIIHPALTIYFILNGWGEEDVLHGKDIQFAIRAIKLCFFLFLFYFSGALFSYLSAINNPAPQSLLPSPLSPVYV